MSSKLQWYKHSGRHREPITLPGPHLCRWAKQITVGLGVSLLLWEGST